MFHLSKISAKVYSVVNTSSKAFDSLLGELSARFANMSSDQFESEIESALRHLLDFLGFDRGSFAEITADGWASVLCSVAMNGVEPFPLGPLPGFFDWYVSQARAGKVIVLRSMKDLPSEATGEAEYFRLSGLRSKLGIPLRVGGRFVANIGFAAFSTTQTWPDHLIVKLKLLGEAFALALARKRAEEKLTHALAEIEQLRNGNKYLPTEHVLCSRFGLTAAEARVALGIARGETIASVAGRHNVTVSTARSQLKSVFSKLGAHRQAELVALLGGKLF
jgi:DNA-binding CsgD family transcriptional regulator